MGWGRGPRPNVAFGRHFDALFLLAFLFLYDQKSSFCGALLFSVFDKRVGVPETDENRGGRPTDERRRTAVMTVGWPLDLSSRPPLFTVCTTAVCPTFLYVPPPYRPSSRFLLPYPRQAPSRSRRPACGRPKEERHRTQPPVKSSTCLPPSTTHGTRKGWSRTRRRRPSSALAASAAGAPAAAVAAVMAA